MTKCPVCGTKKPQHPITANDGGSIVCPGCGTLYHECSDGVTRAGYSPLTCTHCGYRKVQHVGYSLGSFAVDEGTEYIRVPEQIRTREFAD